MNEITVDIDEPYYEFRNSNFFEIIECRLNKIPFITGVYLRRSSRGNVHLKIAFSVELSVFESLQIRACLGDDPQRLANDLCRYYRTRDERNVGRCFDQKYIDGVLAVAGEWERF